MADFEISLQRTLRFEDETLSGVITYDSGGTTRFGISENSNSDVFPEMAECSIARAIEIAGQIYRARYWKFDDVADQNVANHLFDVAVNQGLGMSVMMIQRCAGTTADGVWGPMTLQAVNTMSGSTLLLCFEQAVAARYRMLADSNPAKYGQYLKGWLARASTP